jgi:hypothetical protein
MATTQDANPDKLLLMIGAVAAGLAVLLVIATFFGVI